MTCWLIGIDIVEIERFRAYPQSEHLRFYERVFDEYEFQYCNGYSDPYPHFAGIFAAKEAVYKAINKLKPLSLSQISIHHDENGKPIVKLEKNDKSPPTGDKLSNSEEDFEVQVSITHSRNIALAWALTLPKIFQNNLLEGLNSFKAELQREIENEFVEYRCTS